MFGRKKQPPPIVQTRYGEIKGLRSVSCYKTPYFRFHNIPYAEQPVGDLRFKDPQPLKPWNGVLNATKVGSACYQYEKLTAKIQKALGGEKCLHLNIYTKELSPDKPKPVMVFIHGGGFRHGSGSPFVYGSDYLIEQNIVLVTINYRLLMFGFLSFKDPKIGVPGNAGLKDQNMALEWIKENILAFGGDPDNITLFGESAGSVSVHLHLLSPASKRLFHRAILMSGSAFCPWVITPERGINLRLAQACGYKGPDNEQEIYNFLIQVNPKKLIKAELTLLTPEERSFLEFIAFGPVVEPYSSNNTFLPLHPKELAKQAWGNDIDVIVGGCSDEGLLFWSSANEKSFKSPQLFERLVATSINTSDLTACTENAKLLRNAYYGNEEPSNANRLKYIDLLTDKMFLHGNQLMLLARNGNGKAWLYRFAAEPVIGVVRMVFGIPHKKGTAHGEDLLYLFKPSLVKAYKPGSREHKVMAQLVSAFTTFARTGNPNCRTIPHTWPVLESSEPGWKCLNITSDEVKVIPLPEFERLKVWDTICGDQLSSRL